MTEKADALRNLLILQERDQRVRELRRQLQALPREKDSLEARIKDRGAALQQHRLDAQHVETQRKELDLEVQSHKHQIAKYRQQQLQTRKNDEYAALGHEIERAEKRIVEIEDRELDLMEKFEAAQKAVASESAQVAEFEKAVRAQIADVEKKLRAVEAQIAEAEAERTTARAGVAPDILKRYQRILDHRGDAALVPLVHGSICGGCHMKVTSQTSLDVKAARGIVACENCGRILYEPGE
ncbi:MAG TPA: C4-type zinc ribbon domain-containing protein [Verrucomicrobiae bacterium]|nr:C4-type zinc ribbon domain-containing protein [Verrucomicrobiae bacterium]